MPFCSITAALLSSALAPLLARAPVTNGVQTKQKLHYQPPIRAAAVSSAAQNALDPSCGNNRTEVRACVRACSRRDNGDSTAVRKHARSHFAAPRIKLCAFGDLFVNRARAFGGGALNWRTNAIGLWKSCWQCRRNVERRRRACELSPALTCVVFV